MASWTGSPCAVHVVRGDKLHSDTHIIALVPRATPRDVWRAAGSPHAPLAARDTNGDALALDAPLATGTTDLTFDVPEACECAHGACAVPAGAAWPLSHTVLSADERAHLARFHVVCVADARARAASPDAAVRAHVPPRLRDPSHVYYVDRARAYDTFDDGPVTCRLPPQALPPVAGATAAGITMLLAREPGVVSDVRHDLLLGAYIGRAAPLCAAGHGRVQRIYALDALALGEAASVKRANPACHGVLGGAVPLDALDRAAVHARACAPSAHGHGAHAVSLVPALDVATVRLLIGAQRGVCAVDAFGAMYEVVGAEGAGTRIVRHALDVAPVPYHERLFRGAAGASRIELDVLPASGSVPARVVRLAVQLDAQSAADHERHVAARAEHTIEYTAPGAWIESDAPAPVALHFGAGSAATLLYAWYNPAPVASASPWARALATPVRALRCATVHGPAAKSEADARAWLAQYAGVS